MRSVRLAHAARPWQACAGNRSCDVRRTERTLGSNQSSARTCSIGKADRRRTDRITGRGQERRRAHPRGPTRAAPRLPGCNPAGDVPEMFLQFRREARGVPRDARRARSQLHAGFFDGARRHDIFAAPRPAARRWRDPSLWRDARGDLSRLSTRRGACTHCRRCRQQSASCARPHTRNRYRSARAFRAATAERVGDRRDAAGPGHLSSSSRGDFGNSCRQCGR